MGPSLPNVQGLPIFKPPYNRLSAYDMNTGTRKWWIPIGATPAAVANHPALKGKTIPPTGGGGNSIQMVTQSILIATEARTAMLAAYNKATGQKIGTVKMPAPGQYGMMSFMHDGHQYIVVQIGGGQYPGSLAALALPGALPPRYGGGPPEAP